MPVRIFVRTAVKMELGMGKTAGGEVFWGWGEMSSVLAMLNLDFLDQIGSWIYEFGVQERGLN